MAQLIEHVLEYWIRMHVKTMISLLLCLQFKLLNTLVGILKNGACSTWTSGWTKFVGLADYELIFDKHTVQGLVAAVL